MSKPLSSNNETARRIAAKIQLMGLPKAPPPKQVKKTSRRLASARLLGLHLEIPDQPQRPRDQIRELPDASLGALWPQARNRLALGALGASPASPSEEPSRRRKALASPGGFRES